jgi:CDP-diacylglycerol--glycerol-3-phosphate 3-phosphatidyltransferase
MFILVSRGMFSPWLVGLIAAREIAISLYRVFAGAKGVSVPASKAAKFKTFAQQVSVGFAVLPWSAADYNYLAKGSLGIATVLTLYSGLQYGAVALKARKQA